MESLLELILTPQVFAIKALFLLIALSFICLFIHKIINQPILVIKIAIYILSLLTVTWGSFFIFSALLSKANGDKEAAAVVAAIGSMGMFFVTKNLMDRFLSKKEEDNSQ